MLHLLVSGWDSLRSLAAQSGAALSPAYLMDLVNNKGVSAAPLPFYEAL